MKVLWISNTIFPELAKHLGMNVPVVGGWMYGLANSLVKSGISLTVATSRPNIKSAQKTFEGISYFLLNGKEQSIKFDASLKSQWKSIVSKVDPDVVHIHGTEYAHGLSLMHACPDLNYVISIQGLVSVYSRYYTGHIPYRTIKKNITLRDFLKNDGILQSQKKFYERGELVEKSFFNLGNHFIGRTLWDSHHTITLNPNATYHFCNESLRNSFYESRKWDIEKMQPYTIFLSQAIYPLKGLHQVLKALKFIKKDFPKVNVRIAGGNIIKSSSLRDKLALTGYGKYVRSLIDEFQLHEHIEFTGPLNEFEMIQEYLNCNVFICPSNIENSPNSLGEAQLLGVPSLGSYVGGIPDMIEHGKSGLLYRYEEEEMLAQYVKKIFSSPDLMKKLSFEAIKVASERHNREANLKRTLEIYEKIKNQ